MEKSNWGEACSSQNGGITEEEYSSETPVRAYQTAWYYNPETHNLNEYTRVFYLGMWRVWVRRGGVQGLGGETGGKETTGGTQAQMGG